MILIIDRTYIQLHYKTVIKKGFLERKYQKIFQHSINNSSDEEISIPYRLKQIINLIIQVKLATNLQYFDIRVKLYQK